MSIPKITPGHIIQDGDGPEAVAVELWMDVTCPFSAKMMATLLDGGVLRAHPTVRFVVHQVVQPWHPQSTLVHEALFAARRLVASPRDAVFLKFVSALFAAQPDFTDVHVWNEPRSTVHAKLRALASDAGLDADALQQLLDINQKLVDDGMKNPGSGVTADLKAAVKYHRKRGVHVTPTVFVNGIEAAQIGSSASAAQWAEFLGEI